MRSSWCVSFLLGLTSLSWAGDLLPESEYSRLRSVRRRERLLYEAYLHDEGDLSAVFGYNFDRYFHKNTFFELAIFGAVTGSRGGYGIAAFGLGQRWPLARILDGDFKVVTGSGGGGGLGAGGGLALHVSSGVSLRLVKGLFWELRGGYLAFPTGHFKTATLSTGLSLESWEVELGDE